ncbi:MAG TPA: phosphatase PAP2 family protein, partial [Armatimonadetes bacterium]|nr:phosphatase PAP2 family protein [Armatimonadota bacterium]
MLPEASAEEVAVALGAFLLLATMEERWRLFPLSKGKREKAKLVGDLSLLALALSQPEKEEAALATLNALITVQALKLLTCRRRPLEGRGFRGPLKRFDSSFPSGHAAMAFALARLLNERRAERKGLWLGLATLVCLSRV